MYNVYRIMQLGDVCPDKQTDKWEYCMSGLHPMKMI